MLLAELVVRHTRRFVPTRRVALETAFLPTSGPAHGTSLIVALFAEHRDDLADDQLEMIDTALSHARRGIDVPSIVARHRLQTDTHGLDRSTHRLLGESGRLVAELDVHGAPMPQLLGALLALGELPSAARADALRALREVMAGRRQLSAAVRVRRLIYGRPVPRPPRPGVRWAADAPPGATWAGVRSDVRWAMQVLELEPDDELSVPALRSRYREQVRAAHPDQGGADDTAAQRLAELNEARRILVTASATSTMQPTNPRAAEKGAASAAGSDVR